MVCDIIICTAYNYFHIQVPYYNAWCGQCILQKLQHVTKFNESTTSSFLDNGDYKAARSSVNAEKNRFKNILPSKIIISGMFSYLHCIYYMVSVGLKFLYGLEVKSISSWNTTLLLIFRFGKNDAVIIGGFFGDKLLWHFFFQIKISTQSLPKNEFFSFRRLYSEIVYNFDRFFSSIITTAYHLINI